MPKIIFQFTNKKSIIVEVPVGTTILDAALNNNIYIPHSCGGNCSCSTCHVVIMKGIETLNNITDEEEEMLEELEEEKTETSRLSCQCKITNDLIVTITDDF